jgi:hypothetical protein
VNSNQVLTFNAVTIPAQAALPHPGKIRCADLTFLRIKADVGGLPAAAMPGGAQAVLSQHAVNSFSTNNLEFASYTQYDLLWNLPA